MANLKQVVYLTQADYAALLNDTHDPKQYTKNGKTIYFDPNTLYITESTVSMSELNGVLPVNKGGTGTITLTAGQLLVGNGTNAVSTKGVASTITNDANTVPSTQAVYNSALLKSGGTMTGVLVTKGNQYDDSITSTTSHAINMNNSNIIGLNSIYTCDASDNASEGIHFYRDSTHFDSLWANGGDLLFVPNRALGASTTKANSQKVGRFTANPTSGQVVITDGTTGGMKSSGYTIAKSVPSDAVFTDTTYSSKDAANGGTDVSLVTTGEKYIWNNKTSNTGTVTSVAASGSDGISISGSPITTSGTIAIGLNLSTAINGLGEGTSPAQLNDYLVAQFAGGGTTTTTYHRRKVSNVVNATVVKAALGTNSTHGDTYLRKDGTWQTPPYPVTSVAGNTGAITADTLRTSLGLSNAMHFRGIATVAIDEGTNKKANPTITGYDFGTNGANALAGDVIIDKDSAYEYVWSADGTNGQWERLGGDSSYKTTQTAVNDPTAATTTSTTFIDTISQNTNGVITATKKTLPTANTSVAGIIKIGTTENDACAGNDSRLSNARTPTSHTHGNIQNGGTLQTNDVTIASGDKLVITDSSDSSKIARASISFDGSTATKALTQKGTWETFNNYSLPLAASGTRGGIQIGFSTSAANRQYAVALSSEKAYVEVPLFVKSGSTAAAGLVPSPGTTAGTTKFLREDATWVVPTDTKNTAGSTNSTSKLFLIGATSQNTNPTTNSYQYTYTNNGLLSSTKLGLNVSGTEKAHIEWNTTDLSLDFIFD